MNDAAWAKRVLSAVDGKDVSGFLSFLTEDVVFRIGNGPAIRGRDAVRGVVGDFLGSIRGSAHQIGQVWEHPDALIIEGEVTYTRNDGVEKRYPFVDVFRLREGQIREYLIYADYSTLFA